MNKPSSLGFLLISLNMLCCSNVAKRFNETIWHDKTERYAISENLVDSCNQLSLITRERNYKRLECIKRIGDNDHFIIAETSNTGVGLNYWIINKDKDGIELLANQIVQGPYNLIDFTNLEKALGIDSLKFQEIK